jgi:hypothetical protein
MKLLLASGVSHVREAVSGAPQVDKGMVERLVKEWVDQE